MPKKLAVDSLASEITSVSELLANAKRANDFIGEMQLEYRLSVLNSQLEHLKSETYEDNSASVALFFGGKPVVGSKGISAEFAGLALEQFQNLISKTFAISESGAIGSRGRVPFKAHSELMVTGVARGSFGFILDEMSGQTETEQTELTLVVDKVAHLLRDTAAQDDAVFESILEDLEPRTLMALKEFFANLDSNQATLRIVERDFDFVLDASAIHRGKVRTEATSIDEKISDIEGVLLGFLPEHRKFEIKVDSGNVIYGSVAKVAVEQFIKESEVVIGKKCFAQIVIKTISPLNRPSRDIIRLVEFLRFG